MLNKLVAFFRTKSRLTRLLVSDGQYVQEEIKEILKKFLGLASNEEVKEPKIEKEPSEDINPNYFVVDEIVTRVDLVNIETEIVILTNDDDIGKVNVKDNTLGNVEQ